MTGYIYILRSDATQKVYIGQTVSTLSSRLSNHRSVARAGGKSLIYRAMRKYGLESFSIHSIEEVEEATAEALQQSLNEKEISWIAHYKSNDRSIGYNLTEGGGGVIGLDAEVRQRLSDQRRGTPKWSDEQKRQRAEVMRERWAQRSAAERQEIGEKISLAQKGREGNRLGAVNSLEHNQKISEALRGQPGHRLGHTNSEEHRRRISEARKGQPHYMKGKKREMTAEEKQRRSDAAKRRWAKRRGAA
jgi:group I intron endonuclease